MRPASAKVAGSSGSGNNAGVNDTERDRWAGLAARIKARGLELGFSQIAVSDVDLSAAEPRLLSWLERGHHGTMAYMARHGVRRARPAELVPGTLRVITARMDYAPAREGWIAREEARLRDPQAAVVSVYARGRDYHKVLRARLQQLAGFIESEVGAYGHRVFTDSAPVMEVELAVKSGLGWRGKHTLLLDREGGSFFFLGELFVSLPLPVDAPASAHCGSCTRCIDVCPTRAIVAPYVLDARRCISYLTIEHEGPIPLELRPLMGNRIYGCDDCQLVCPWNKYARVCAAPDFAPRHGLDAASLLDLWQWSEAEFLRRTEGSAIRRIGPARWLRNLAVALGNALRASGDARIAQALQRHAQHPSALVREHVQWALAQRDAQPAADGPPPQAVHNVVS
jgi:epoxyqueuosine reductase